MKRLLSFLASAVVVLLLSILFAVIAHDLCTLLPGGLR